MSEVNPALQLYTQAAAAIDGNTVAGQSRLTVLTRANEGTVRAQQLAGQASVAGTSHVNFMNGAEWDLRSDGSNTPQVYRVNAGTVTQIVTSIALLVVFNTAPVLNGNSFGARYQGGLLGTQTLIPGPLNNGISLVAQAAGVATPMTTILVNEDLLVSAPAPQFGSVGTPYLMRLRLDLSQTLTGGSNDNLTWTIRDNLTVNRSITEIRAVATLTSAV